MNGKSGATYESFLGRCLEGVRQEQETLPELEKAVKSFEALIQKGYALGLRNRWWFAGAGVLGEAYRKGKEAFEREGDVYAYLAALGSLSKHGEEVLKAEERRLQEEAERRKREQEEKARRKREQKKAEERRQREEAARAAAAAAKVERVRNMRIAACLAGIVLLIVGWCYWKDAREKAAQEAEVQRQEAVAREKAAQETAEIERINLELRAKDIHRPGERRIVELPGSVKMEMVWCPLGTFRMGSENGAKDEKPVRRVTLTQGFWMAKTEVTQAQWLSVMDSNPSYHKGNNLPVECVSWEDAQAFCEKTGLRLPTEAEWEYACRAGSTGDYGGALDTMGVYSANSGGQTIPVGQKQPNAWGLCDMHGNVSEWCADWYGSGYYTESPGTNPQGPVSGSYRVNRGGSFRSELYCRSAARNYSRPTNADCYLGFRPILTEGGQVTTRDGAGGEQIGRTGGDKPKRSIATRQAGEIQTRRLPGGAKMEMVWCPAGAFAMGSPAGEEGRADNETRHRVTLTAGFWMAKTEVTQAQWQSVMGSNPSYHKGDSLPVECVSWKACQEFCRKTGLELPTEAQWEYACRAGSTGAYAGTGTMKEMGWYDDNSLGKTHPVGQKKPNAWGLCDMHGNVWEWCSDWYGEYTSGSVTDPKCVLGGSCRVMRGGSWGVSAGDCRSAGRDYDDPMHASYGLGFRPVYNQSEE